MSLFSGFSIPLHCFNRIINDSRALVVCVTQTILTIYITLFSGFSVPLYCFDKVLRNTFSYFIRYPQIILT